MRHDVNRGCLQRLKWQTPSRNPFYRPHVVVRAAKYNPTDPNQENRYESGKKLHNWVIEEEKKIQRRHYETIRG